MKLVTMLLVLAVLTPVQAFAQAPAALRGKSITVTWTETRSQRDAGKTAFRPVSLPYEFTVYVSSEGRAFKRTTVASASRRHVGSKEGVGAGRTTTEGATATQITGTTFTQTSSSGGLGRRIVVTMDSSYSSCSATVVTAKQSGQKVAAVKSIATGNTVEFESVSAGSASCSIRTGNAFAQ